MLYGHTLKIVINLQDAWSYLETLNKVFTIVLFTETHWQPSKGSKMKLFVKIVNSFRPLTAFTKSSILEV